MVGIGKLGVVFHSLRITQQRLRPKLPILPRLLLDFRSKNQLPFSRRERACLFANCCYNKIVLNCLTATLVFR